MRIHWTAAISIISALACGSSSSPSPTSDAGASGPNQTPAGLTACMGPAGAAHHAIDPKDGKCKLDGTTTNVGAACTASNPNVCGTFENASCLDEKLDFYPGGYCNVDPCTSSDAHACPIGASCVLLEGENGQCFKNCASDADCRTAEKYFCLDMTADDKPGGLWLSGASHKVCSREQVTCPLSPKDCPAAFPRCVLPGGGDAYLPDGGPVGPQGAADAAPPIPVCVK